VKEVCSRKEKSDGQEEKEDQKLSFHRKLIED
jgi:hypothetical protein